MKNSPDHKGRILRHGHQSDDVSDDAIEARARELAILDGRSPSGITSDDRALSSAELRGEMLPPTSVDDAEGVASLSRDPSEPPSTPGSQAPQQNEPEGQEIQERLVLEGVEEAQHDQMLAARRRGSREN